MLNEFMQNAKKPKTTLGGKMMLWGMNRGHERLSRWARSFWTLRPTDVGIDLGCGGGRNVQTFLKQVDKVYGLDYSEASVAMSQSLNKAAVAEGRCEIIHGEVSRLPFEDAFFDFASAFETVYFWPDLSETFGEVRRILKPDGQFLIAVELSDAESGKKWSERIGFTIYSGEELKEHLLAAGFREVRVHNRGKEAAVLAKK